MPGEPAERIYHVARAVDWASAQAAGEYRVSTRDASIDAVGFIHASFRHQVERIGDLVYRGVDEDLVVLEIDPARLDVPVRVENLEGGDELFPHVYGPLPVAAVVAVLRVSLDADRPLTVHWGDT